MTAIVKDCVAGGDIVASSKSTELLMTIVSLVERGAALRGLAIGMLLGMILGGAVVNVVWLVCS